MADLAQWLNSLPLGVVMRRHGWLFPLLQTLHILATGLVMSSAIMVSLLCFLLALLASPFKSKSRLEAENAALRHQLTILRRKAEGEGTCPTHQRRNRPPSPFTMLLSRHTRRREL